MIGKNQEPDIGKETQFKPGQSGNPDGKPKGTKHLSTMIQELSEEIDWELTSLKSKAELSQKYGKNGLKALIYVAFSKAMSGDTKAMEWLAKHGYGTKLIVETGDPVEEALKKLGLLNNGGEQKNAGETEDTEGETPQSVS